MTGVQTCALPICFPAKKTEAEAEKIAGADTKVAESEAEMLESQSEFNRRITRLQNSIEKLTNAQEQKAAAEYFYIQALEKKVWEEVREQIVKSDIAEETKEAMIKKTGLENFNLMQAGIESITRQKLNNEQINYLRGQIDRKSTRLNSSHRSLSRMPSSA